MRNGTRDSGPLVLLQWTVPSIDIPRDQVCPPAQPSAIPLLGSLRSSDISTNLEFASHPSLPHSLLPHKKLPLKLYLRLWFFFRGSSIRYSISKQFNCRGYPRKIPTHVPREMNTKMLNAILFVTAQKWKQSNSPATEKWINYGLFKLLTII